MYLRGDEIIKLLMFLALVATIVAASAAEALRLTVTRLRVSRRQQSGEPSSPEISRRRRIYRRALLVIDIVALGCVAYGYYEPYRPEITRHTIIDDDLPVGATPMKIVQISDLHCDAKVRLEDRLPGLIGELEPDLIVFTGDAANSDAGLPVFDALIGKLAAIAPLCAVEGNWGVHNTAALSNIYEKHGARMLRNQSIVFEIKENRLTVAGLAFVNSSLDAALQSSVANPAGEPPAPSQTLIVLGHTPDAFFKIAPPLRGAVDFVCCGHTHGGQVAPFGFPLVTLTHCGLGRGRYEIEGVKLYVNRGIGMEGGAAPRVRFGSRPEITLFEIAPPPR
jgi:predicted MPP superfamily phosphohydrolase